MDWRQRGGQRWLTEMPPEGQARYQELHGKAAHELFEKASKNKNSEWLADLTARYPITDAAMKVRELFAKRLENASRAQPLNGNLPLLDSPMWRRSITFEKRGPPFEELDEKDKQTEALVQRILKRIGDGPFVPWGFPLVKGDLLIFRTYRDCAACLLRETPAWSQHGPVKIKPGELAWRSWDFGLSLTMLSDNLEARKVSGTWLDFYLKNGHAHFLLENPFLGAISSDTKRVYAVDDLGVPSPSNPFRFPIHQTFEQTMPYTAQNTLGAFELKTGKCLWLTDVDSKENEFSRSHFLGPPLVLDGRLLVINERNDGELRLVCIDPEREVKLHTPAITHIQPLGIVQPDERYLINPRRRFSPVRLATADGVVVCSTHVGTMFGIDLLTRRLLWGYEYRPQAPKPKSGVIDVNSLPPSEWKACSPFLHAGKVVFTAPDDPHVHCLNLRDGRLVWKVRRTDDDVYLAGVFGNRVLLVGKSSCRALALKDGKPLWNIETGIPSGLGAGNADIYFLPLSKGAISKRPEVCAINLVQGRISGRSESRKGEVPGNLVFHDGFVISQTATAITAYPQKSSE